MRRLLDECLTGGVDRAEVGEIAFVGDEYYWDVGSSTGCKKGSVEAFGVLERLRGVESEDAEKGVAGGEVGVADHGVVLLAGGVHDDDGGWLAVDDAVLAVAVVDGWVVDSRKG